MSRWRFGIDSSVVGVVQTSLLFQMTYWSHWGFVFLRSCWGHSWTIGICILSSMGIQSLSLSLSLSLSRFIFMFMHFRMQWWRALPIWLNSSMCCELRVLQQTLAHTCATLCIPTFWSYFAQPTLQLLFAYRIHWKIVNVPTYIWHCIYIYICVHI